MNIPLRVRFTTILMLLLLAFPALLPAQRQLFHEYGSADGLSNLNVRCLLQDHIGYIWVGTDNGLFRYDGGKFRVYDHTDGLRNTEILTLAESPEGALWVGTNGGVATLSGQRFQAMDVGEQGATHRIGFDAAGDVYLEHDSGIIRGALADAGTYRFHLVVAGSVSGLSVNDGEILFGQDGGLWHLKGDLAERFRDSFGLPTDQWDSIVQDSLGNEWIRSKTRLYELPRGQKHFVDRSNGIPRAVQAFVYADRHGRIFVPTISGVMVLAGNRRSVIDATHGLPADPSGPMLIDREELLWMGTEGGGLIRRLGHGEWLAWKEDDGLLRNSVWAIKSDHFGDVWVGTNGGLTILKPNGKVLRDWTRRNGLPGDRVFSLAEGPGGDFYVGTDTSEIGHFSPEGNLLHSYGPESGYLATRVSSMAFDHEGRLWAVGTDGCFRSHAPVGKGPVSFDRMDIPGIVSHTFFRDVIVDDRDSIWIASSRGLAKFDGNRWRVFSERDGLKSADLGVVALAQGSIWIAYRDALGMSRLQGDRPNLIHVTMQNGLHSDQVYALASDHKGRLWVNTDMGVDVLDAGRWTHFGNENGLIWNDTDSLALDVDAEDNVWIGTSAGLSRFSQPEFPTDEQPARVVLTSITGKSKQWQVGDDPILPFSERSLSIEYAALAYESVSSTRYRYRLAGFDKNWTETTERGVHYAALPPGHYVFEVMATGPNGLWSPTPARFAFTIRPPWWWTWWFISSVIIFALVVGSVFVRLRIRVLEGQKKALEQQVADRTEELVKSHRQLEEIAYCDMLTNTSNRRMFVEEFRKRVTDAEHAEPFTLLLVDLDFFKHVNDTFGHDAGDAVLVETAARIKAEVRQTDCVARLGGDEFAILLFSALDVDATEALCARLLTALSAPIHYKNLRLEVGCSIGIARFPSEGDSQESLYKSADRALYRAKQRGRNVFCWHQGHGEESSALQIKS